MIDGFSARIAVCPRVVATCVIARVTKLILDVTCVAGERARHDDGRGAGVCHPGQHDRQAALRPGQTPFASRDAADADAVDVSEEGGNPDCSFCGLHIGCGHITRLIPKLFPAHVACFCCSVKIFALPLVSNGTRSVHELCASLPIGRRSFLRFCSNFNDT